MVFSIISCGSCPIYDNVTDSCIFDSNAQYFIPCNPLQWECTFSGSNFLLDTSSSIFMNGTCELSLDFQGDVFFGTGSSIVSSAVYISAEEITICHDSTIQTSNRGNFQGPGAPVLNNGYGGAYGGSGSERPCQDDYYSSTNSPMGSVDVAADVSYYRALEEDYVANFYSSDPTFGSGSGSSDGAHGGGRIVLNASHLVNISGLLEANGGGAVSSGAQLGTGGGSGGSITIISETVISSQDALLSAIGGNGVTNQATSTIIGGAGGGGRVMVQYDSSLGQSIAVPQVMVNGGISFSSSGFSKNCGAGGAGTLYVLDLKYENGILYVGNEDTATLAVTLFDSEADRAPKMFKEVDVIGSAVLSPNKLIADGFDGAINVFSGGEIVSISGFSDTVTIRCETLNVVDGTISVETIVIEAYLSYEMDSSSSLSFMKSANITVEMGNLTINGNIAYDGLEAEATQSVSLILSAMSITISETSLVTVGYIYLYANESMIVDGDISSFVQSCGYCIDSSAWSCPLQYDLNSNFSVVLSVSSDSSVIAGNGHVRLNSNAAISGGSIIVCAPNIDINDNAVISTNGMGCSAEEGVGSGMDGLGSSGSGGGYGGVGGISAAGDVGGLMYGSNDGFTYCAGSGGGFELGGASGGIVKLVASASLHLDGSVSSNGINGISDSAGGGGGGSGGSVSVLAATMSGSTFGELSANGGDGDDLYGAGGAGGGRICLSSSSFSFLGNLIVASGLGGNGGSAGEVGTFFLPICPPGQGNQVDSDSYEIDGSSICSACPKGTYQSESSSAACLECTNKPDHSYYAEKGEISSDCGYKCDSGYSGSSCATAMAKLINQLGGPGGFAGVMIGIVACILILIFCINAVATSLSKLKRSYQLLEWTTFQNANHGEAFDFNQERYSDITTMMDKASYASMMKQPLMNTSDIRYASFKTLKQPAERPNQAALQEGDDTVWAKIARRIHRYNATEHSLGAKDRFSCAIARKLMNIREGQLQRHMGRVYFLGRNFPLRRLGGPWNLPLSPPPLISSMVKHEEYEAFAQRINDAVDWPAYGWEILVYYALVVVFPPLSSVWLSSRRIVRADLLTILVYEYDQDMFVSKHAQDLRDSIRLGMSADNTLAYIDFLSVEEPLVVGQGSKSLEQSQSFGVFLPHLKLALPHNSGRSNHYSSKGSDKDSTISIIPKLVFGQPNLPIAFKFSGLGSYHCPWNIEAGDVLLQSIPHVAGLSRFIDRHWIECIVEINSRIRSMHKSSLERDLPQFLHFLESLSLNQVGSKLGGLRIDCSLFPNIDQSIFLVHPKDYLTEWCGSINLSVLSLDKSFADLQNMRLRYSVSCLFTNPPVSIWKMHDEFSPMSKIFSPMSLYLMSNESVANPVRPVFSKEDMQLSFGNKEPDLDTRSDEGRLRRGKQKTNEKGRLDEGETISSLTSNATVLSDTLAGGDAKSRHDDSYNPFGGRQRSRSVSFEDSGFNSQASSSYNQSKNRRTTLAKDNAAQMQEYSQNFSEMDSLNRICNAVREGFLEIGLLIHIPHVQPRDTLSKDLDDLKSPLPDKSPDRPPGNSKKSSRRYKFGKSKGGKHSSKRIDSEASFDAAGDLKTGIVNTEFRASSEADHQADMHSPLPLGTSGIINVDSLDIALRPVSIESAHQPGESASTFVVEANSTLLQPIQVIRYSHFSQLIESKRNMPISLWRQFKRSVRIGISSLLENHNHLISSPYFDPRIGQELANALSTPVEKGTSPQPIAINIDKGSFDSNPDVERRRTRTTSEDEETGAVIVDKINHGGSGAEGTAWSRQLDKTRLLYFWILAIMLAADVATSVIMLDNLYCVSSTSEHGGGGTLTGTNRRLSDRLQASNGCDVTYFVLVMLLWPPCSIIISPMIGLAVLGVSKSSWIRIYASWNKLSIINAFVALSICLGLYESMADFAVFVSLCVIGAKTVTACTVNKYIALLERRRRSGGWSGLVEEDDEF